MRRMARQENLDLFRYEESALVIPTANVSELTAVYHACCHHEAPTGRKNG